MCYRALYKARSVSVLGFPRCSPRPGALSRNAEAWVWADVSPGLLRCLLWELLRTHSVLCGDGIWGLCPVSK